MAVKWQEFEKDGDRFDIQYRTAGDSKVREEHAALNRTTLPITDPFWKQFFPPLGWNCRCSAIQVRKGKYPTSDSAEAIRKGEEITAKPTQRIFRFNPGIEKKVFPPKHPYLPKGCEGCDQKGKVGLAYGKGKPECEACKILSELHFHSAKKTKEWAKKNIQGMEITHPDLKEKIHISGGGIKEFSNQPHSNYYEKNKLLRNIDSVIREAEYKGLTKIKGRTSHVFEIEMNEEKNWIIANESEGMGVYLYSISESPSVLKGVKK